MTGRRVLIVAGPTCSGKSALAMTLAERLHGTVINADAMQTYRELRVLTARPSQADEQRVPHALYGIRPVTEPCTVAWWCAEALTAIAASPGVPILCGGSGMYLHALLHGLAPIPPIAEDVRGDARLLLASLGAPALLARLAQADPETAAGLRPSDGQRIARAWEVWRGTGKGLAYWQRARPAAAVLQPCAITLAPPRPELRTAIARRWDSMIAADVVAEVDALRTHALNPSLPALRAHGVSELSAFLNGAISLPEAARRTITAIGRYTKRQATWLRHHELAPSAVSIRIDARFTSVAQLSSQEMADMIEFMSYRVDSVSNDA